MAIARRLVPRCRHPLSWLVLLFVIIGVIGEAQVCNESSSSSTGTDGETCTREQGHKVDEDQLDLSISEEESVDKKPSSKKEERATLLKDNVSRLAEEERAAVLPKKHKDERKEPLLVDLWAHFDFEKNWVHPRPIYTIETWRTLRQAYLDTVGSRKSSIPSLEDDESSSFSVAVNVQYAAEKGRGIFAAQDIPRGQHIWSSKQTALFDNREDYKAFLERLEVDIACDVLQFAYVQALPELMGQKDNTRISVDLDDMTFINQIIYDWEEPDAGCFPEWEDLYPGGCERNLFALRHIQKGEEILMDYGSFAISDGWGKFGLQ
jgi:hypothetical protein